jgi:hypothetical protein
MSSQFTYVLKDSRHKKKIRRQMIVASSDVNEKIKPVRIHKGLIYAGVTFVCITLGAAVGYFANEAGIIKGYTEGINIRNERIEGLEAEITRLTGILDSKNSEIDVLSQTVLVKEEEIDSLSEELGSFYIPTEFPMSGSATMTLTSDGEIPVIIFNGSDGDFCRATAAGTVIEIRTNPKDEDDGSIAEYYVAGENTSSSQEVKRDLGYYTVVTIDHGNGYCTVYMNDGDPVVSEGDSVSAGNTLYNLKSGNTSVGYKMILNGEYINPEEVMIISG